MTLSTWIHALLAAPRRATPDMRRFRRRLNVNCLEDRLTPTAGLLDPTFGVGGLVTTRFPIPSNEDLKSTAVDSLGRIVVAGYVSNGADADFAIARYSPAGILDTAFGGAGVVTIDFGYDDQAYGVAVDSFDRVVVAGYTYKYGSNYKFAVARLTNVGALDSSFDGDGKQTVAFSAFDAFCRGVAVDSLDRVVVAGYASNGSNRDFAVARLTAAGALDSSFDGDGKQTIDFGGSDDGAFGVAVDSLDRVVVAGHVLTYTSGFEVARLTASGALDGSFDGDGKQTIDFAGIDDQALGVAVDSVNRVVVAGRAYQGAYNYVIAVARLTASGALDGSFDGDGKQTIDFAGIDDEALGVAVDSVNRVVVAGYTSNGSNGDFAVARLTAAGALDTSFDSDGRQTIDFGGSDSGYAVAIDSLDRVVVAGETRNNSSSDLAVARLTAAGALDTSFDSDGKQTLGLTAASNALDEAVAVDSLGRTVVAGRASNGTTFDFAVTRYTSAGALDTSFGGSGIVMVAFGQADDAFADAFAFCVAVDSLDRVVVAGYASNGSNRDFAVARLTAAGALDSSFDGDGKQTIDFSEFDDEAQGVAVDSLNRVVVAGHVHKTINGIDYFDSVAARLTAAGALDSSFDGDGKQYINFDGYEEASSVAVDSLDRVLVAGWNGADFAVTRLTVSGELDSSFDSDGRQTVDFGGFHDNAYGGVAVDSLDRVVVAGYTSNLANFDFAVARLTSAGALDSSFDGDGRQTVNFGSPGNLANGVTVDSLNRVVVAGDAYNGLNYDIAVVRLTAAGTLDSNFDGDGKQTIDFAGIDDGARGVAIDSADRVVIAVSSGPVFAAARLTGDTTTATVQVNDGSAQRSRVTSLTIRFSGQVTFSGPAAGAFTLVRTGGGAVNFVANVTVVNGGTVVTLNGFSGPETEFGSLRDGRYTLTALASQISAGGQAFDGDGDGAPGGNYVSPPDTYLGNGLHLYRLFGDANGDGVVDFVDLGQFRAAFNSNSGGPFYLAFLDADNSGAVDASDLGQFRSRFNANVFSANPTVASISVNDGGAQRSEVRSITVTFTGPVTFAGGNATAAAAFQLKRVQTNGNVDLTAVLTVDGLGRTVVTLTFSGAETDSISGNNGVPASLSDGRYQLTVLSGSVSGANGLALSGGGPNGNYVSPGDSFQGSGLRLYRLFGDGSGDGVVDATDLGLFRSAFNSNTGSPLYLSFLDADNSGTIDAQDLGQFRGRLNTNVF